MELDKIIKSLSSLNLTTYEIKSYLALMEKDSLTAIEVARISKVPRGRIYEVLKNLLDKGLCRLQPDKVKKYIAVNPKLLRSQIEIRVSSAEEELKQRQKQYNDSINRKIESFNVKIEKEKEKLSLLRQDAGNAVDELEFIFNKGRINDSPVEYIEVVRDFQQASKKILELISITNEEFLTLTKSRTKSKSYDKEQLKSIQKDIHDQRDAGLRALERGVKFRSIYELSLDQATNWVPLKDIEALVEEGQEVRIIDELPFQMIIIDTKIIMFNLEDRISGFTSNASQIISHRGLARGHKILFETLWEKAEDFKDFMKRMKL